jgi:hypothetical protein
MDLRIMNHTRNFIVSFKLAMNKNLISMSVKFRFVGELFNANVLSAHTLLEFLQNIPDKLTNRGFDTTCCLLKAAGKKLEQVI